MILQCLESICDQDNTRKACIQVTLFPLWSLNKIDRLRYSKMAKKQKQKQKQTKIREKMHQLL